MGKEVMVTIASCALVKGYASTVVNAVGARNVEGHQYAITVVDAVRARNAKGVKNEANGTKARSMQLLILPS